MKQKTLIQKIVFVSITLCSLSFSSLAQDDFDDDTNDNSAPIDGGMTLLLAAGAGYGIKKVYDLQKRKSR